MANNDRWIFARSEEDAKQKALAKLGCTEDQLVLERDEDVLDTWFSSGLFPFSVMGWPDTTDDLKAFYPTSLLETGLDIIFFWVARMVMMGLELTDTLPFHTVFLHAMVRDKEGRKMARLRFRSSSNSCMKPNVRARLTSFTKEVLLKSMVACFVYCLYTGWS